MSRPKKVHKSQQERKKEANIRRAEAQRKEDRNTYIMLGILTAVFVVVLAILILR